ncbi:MAG: sugar phosphate isomerase/epimerase [Planctomycetia bacterium]|nr:sugar phosphate isomerase/epimerase [Planctomycetia bacterium]
MPRKLALFTGPWSDIPLEELVSKAHEWGYQELDLACWGEHLAVQKALSEPDYGRSILELLAEHNLKLNAISQHAVGQAVADQLSHYHSTTLPEWVWGDGVHEAVHARAAQEMIDTAKVAQQLGVNLVHAATGSPFSLQHQWLGYGSPEVTVQCWKIFTDRWKPILTEFEKMNIMLACEVGPAQTAFDIYSTQETIQALEGQLSYSLAISPAALHWHGVDPIEYLRQFSDRISQILVQDVAVTLNGRSSLLGSLLPDGDYRRGWNHRAPGYGNLDWPSLLRTLHQIHYEGPVTVCIKDADINKDHAAAEAVHFIRRLDYEPA